MNVEERKKRLLGYANQFKIPEKAVLGMMEEYDRHYNRICDEIQGKKINDILSILAKELAELHLFLDMHHEAIRILIRKTDHL